MSQNSSFSQPFEKANTILNSGEMQKQAVGKTWPASLDRKKSLQICQLLLKLLTLIPNSMKIMQC